VYPGDAAATVPATHRFCGLGGAGCSWEKTLEKSAL